MYDNNKYRFEKKRPLKAIITLIDLKKSEVSNFLGQPT